MAASTPPGVANNNGTIRFVRRKETTNKVVFEEQPDEGKPPIIGSLYVSKWWAGSANTVKVALSKE